MRHMTKLMAAAAALAIAPAANAADIFPGNPTAVPNAFFNVSGNIFDGPISATMGRSGLPSGTFTDRFLFTIPQNGIGGGSLSTTFAGIAGGPTDLDFLSVVFNNGTNDFVVSTGASNGSESGGLSNIPITAGVQNSLTVTYLSRGQGSFGGNLAFTPNAIPEPASWAMMLMGFAGMGMVIRRRKQKAKVSYAF